MRANAINPSSRKIRPPDLKEADLTLFAGWAPSRNLFLIPPAEGMASGFSA